MAACCRGQRSRIALRWRNLHRWRGGRQCGPGIRRESKSKLRPAYTISVASPHGSHLARTPTSRVVQISIHMSRFELPAAANKPAWKHPGPLLRPEGGCREALGTDETSATSEVSHIPIVRTVASSSQLAFTFSRRDSSSRRRTFPKPEMPRSMCHSRMLSDSGPSCQAA